MTKRRLLRWSLILVILAAFAVWLEPTRVVWGWLRGVLPGAADDLLLRGRRWAMMAESQGESAMRLIDLKDLTPEHFKAFAESGELTPEEKAEASRLFMAQLSEADLQCVNWDDATPFEDFLNELKEEQRQWDEQKR